VACRNGATIAGPARAEYAFPYHAMAEGDEITVGNVTVRAMETPGHTPEHTSYLVFEGRAEEPTAVFTGGSLMVGGAGRTDLFGPERAGELTRAQFHSLRRLRDLGAQTQVLPTHGAGSFCAAPASGGLTSTLALERATNPALALLSDEDEFLRARLQDLPRFPAYYRFMAPINRAGPRVLADLPEPAPLTPDDVELAVDSGAWVLDGRDRWSFAEAHLPGALNVELDDSFSSYVGSVIPFGTRLVLVLPEPARDAGVDAVTHLVRIGYDSLTGFLEGGVQAWRESGRPLDSYPARDVAALPVGDPAAQVLDVRQPVEVADRSIPGSRHIFLGDLPQRTGELSRDRVVWVVCASGRRAAVGASLLRRAGFRVVVVARGGVPSWAAAAA
jgi:rhodanese-related sulfurtransferase